MGMSAEATELKELFKERRELKHKRGEMGHVTYEKELKSIRDRIRTATERLMVALDQNRLKAGRRQPVSVADLARVRLWSHLEEREPVPFEKIMELTEVYAFFQPAESIVCANLWAGLGLDENDFSYKLCADGQERDLSSVPWEKLELIIGAAKKGCLSLYGSTNGDRCVLLR